MWVLLFFNVFIGLATYITFQLPETPIYLISKGKFNQAKKAFNFIAKINKKPSLAKGTMFEIEKNKDVTQNEIITKITGRKLSES
jgi:hypothetical protein